MNKAEAIEFEKIMTLSIRSLKRYEDKVNKLMLKHKSNRLLWLKLKLAKSNIKDAHVTLNAAFELESELQIRELHKKSYLSSNKFEHGKKS